MSSMSGGFGYGGLQSGAGIAGNKIPRGYSQGQISQYTPQQQQLFQQQFQNINPESYLGKLASGDQSGFAEIEAPALRQFSELQGGLASRFSGLGQGARRSSGFQNTTNSAASNFAQDLQSRRQGMRQSAIESLMNMSNQLLGQRPFEQFLEKKQSKPSSGWGGAIGAGLGGLGGFLAGGPAGALTGSQLGYNVGSGF